MSELRQGGTTLLAKYDWDALSRRSKITFGNTTTASYGYKPNDDLATITHQLKTSAVTFSYSYNQAGQRTQTAVTDDRFLFHPAANETVDYAANALNQYTLVNSAALTYDGKGNLTGDGVGSFTYDTENRMTGATVPGKVATYAYDPMGRRKSKTVNGVVTSYLHDGHREIAEYNGSGGLLRRYVYGVNLDEPLLQITSTGTKFYYRADALGSIVANEEHSSSFVQRFNYGAFGETTAATGHPYRYAARRIDEETGLYYYRARMYSPALGRFMQADPIGYRGGINLYAYVGNDPLNLIDPMGLNSQPESQLAGGKGSSQVLMVQDDSITKAYPLENAIAAVSGGAVLRTIGSAIIRQFLPDPVTPPPNGANNAANAPRLAQQLRAESARSPFDNSGALTREAIGNSREIIPSGQIQNPAVPSGMSKFSTETYQSPSGDFQVHFYYNSQTGQAFYGLDYKSLFLR